jgi:acyl transferase domain-containing protein
VAKNSPDINQTEIAQPVLFIIEYALAKLLMKWGITPGAMIGHSIGEYTSACLSGVFSLEDALKIVVLRGKLMQEMPPGTMLSIPLTEEELTPLLDNEISLAAVNSSSYCVVSGNDGAIDRFEKKIKKKGHDSTRLQTTHAFHSGMMNPILAEFEESLRQIKLNKPGIPYISNLTGKWITAEETTNPRYWCSHLRETVRFSDGISEILKKGTVVFLEVGPGKTLSTFVRNHKNKQAGQFVINLIRHPKENIADDRFLLTGIGQIWLHGVTVDWKKFHEGEEKHRIPLPVYPFEGQKYWLGRDSSGLEMKFLEEMVKAGGKTGAADWYYIPSWKRTSITTGKLKQIPAENPCRWLVFVDKCGLGIQLLEKLKKAKQHVITVQEGREFSGQKEIEFTIQPGQDSDYEALFTGLKRNNKIPDKIVHLWGVDGVNRGDNGLDPADVDAAQELGFFSLLNIAWALGKQNPAKSIEITVVTDNMQEVNGEDGLYPGKATVLGPARAIPYEYPNIKCRSIDLSLSKKWSPRDEEPVRQLFNELTGECFDPVVAYRNFHRWEQTFEPIRLEKNREKSFHLRQQGVYLLIGGLGGIGLLLAEHLAKTVRAKLVLTGRSPFPPKKEWQRLLNREVKEDREIKDKIRRLKVLEDNGAEVLVLTADVTDEKQMRGVIRKTLDTFSRINGVIHSAGLPDGELIRRKNGKQREKSWRLKSTARYYWIES